MASAEVVEVVGVVDSVWGVPASGLDEPGLSARLWVLECSDRSNEAERARVLAEVDRRGLFQDGAHSSVKGWARSKTLWSGRDAPAHAQVARLCAVLPAVAVALDAGSVGVGQVQELARVFANPRVRAEMADFVDIFLSAAGELSFEQFRAMVRVWESTVDADGAFRDHEMSHRNRRASIHADECSTVLHAQGGNVQGAEMVEIFERYKQAEFHQDWADAKALHGDATTKADLRRTPAQRAFDALHQMCLDAVSTPAGSRAPEPALTIVADVHTFVDALADFARLLAGVDNVDPTTTLHGFLAGLDPDLAADAAERAAADVANPGGRGDPRWWRCSTVGGIPLPRSVLIEALLQGQLRRAVIDSAGIVTDLGRKRRFFTGPLRDALMLLTDHCEWCGCSRTSRQSQADHIHDHQHGGPTSTVNGAVLCGFHNRAKNRGFTVNRDGNGHIRCYRPNGTPI